MATMVRHNVETWFKDQDFITYFNTKFKRNTINTLDFQTSIANRWDLTQGEQKVKLAESIAQIYIDAIVRIKNTQLRWLPFANILVEDQEQLRECVCEAVQHCLYNNNVYQRITSSSISTSGFQINVDSTPWLLTSDMFGMIAWNILQNSEIDFYELKGWGQLTVEQQNGVSYKVVAVEKDLTNVPPIVWDTK